MKLERDLFLIEYDPEQIEPSAMIAAIDALGFRGRELSAAEALSEPEVQPVEQSPLIQRLLDQARRADKPLVLEFSGEFCAACRRLERETLEDPTVQKALERVLFRKIMVEQNRPAASQFDIHSIPQLRFLTPDGRLVAKDQGVISVEAMLAHLNRLASHH